jgi:hypothetical protein
LPGTFPDSAWQEPVDILPVATASTHVAFLNGTVFVADSADANDRVQITPTGAGGATVSSNLGSGTFANVTAVVVALGGGNHRVQIGNLPAATVTVTTFDGGSDISIGDTAKLLVHAAGGNNHITTGNVGPAAQLIFVGGDGNNHITVANTTVAEILVAGNGNNHISAAGSGDFIEVLGNGNNQITDTGSGDLVWLGGDGNNDIDNAGPGSFTVILVGTGHNRIRGAH